MRHRRTGDYKPLNHGHSLNLARERHEQTRTTNLEMLNRVRRFLEQVPGDFDNVDWGDVGTQVEVNRKLAEVLGFLGWPFEHERTPL